MASDREGLEFSAKTVDEAVAQALQHLGLRREQVTVEVLHPGSPGRLLGFGAEPARVRVRPVDDALGSVSLAAGVRAEPDDADAEDGDTEDGDTEDGDTEDGDAEEQARMLGLGRSAGARAGLRRDEDTGGAGEAEEESRSPEDLAGEAELARLMLVELLNRMSVDDATVEVVGTDPIMLNIRGDDLADLIGRRGENLRAIQFVLNLMVNKQLRRRLRVQIDVDGYRARRDDLLRSMAQRFAYRVRQTREPMQLETMPPNERRIIHLALADDPDVFTESIGEGDSRRVVIKPKR